MHLPVDPAAITKGDIGEQRATLAMDHESAIEHVRDVFTEAGFGIPVEFSVSSLLNTKVDAGRDPYYVLGACNPEIADRALSATEGQLGGLVPCNVVIWEDSPNEQVVYHLSIMRIARLVDLAIDEQEMETIIEETGERVETAFEML
jgi:uncharacterized protein (DUF302 family)